MSIASRPDPAGTTASAGFTLIEMLVALLLFALLSLAGVSLVQTVLDSQRRTDGRLDRLAALQRAMFVLTADFSQLTAGPTLDRGAVEFRRNSAAGERTIRYALADGGMTRAIDGQQRTLVAGVAGASWSFHRPDGSWSPAPADATDDARPDAVALTMTLAAGGTLRRVVALPAAP